MWQLLQSTEGVFIHVTTAAADEDVLIAGHVFIWQKVSLGCLQYFLYASMH